MAFGGYARTGGPACLRCLIAATVARQVGSKLGEKAPALQDSSRFNAETLRLRYDLTTFSTMETDKAIEDQLNNDERWLAEWLRKGYDKADRRYLRARFKAGTMTFETKEKLLTEFGFTVKQPLTWEKPAAA